MYIFYLIEKLNSVYFLGKLSLQFKFWHEIWKVKAINNNKYLFCETLDVNFPYELTNIWS